MAAFPNGGSELPQSPAAAFPNAQLGAQVQGLEQMMQQMVLQQQTFMQTMAASVQQQQQPFQQQSQTFMQTMEASMHQQMQLLKQQVASSVPAPPVAPGSPVLESYRISTPSPGRSPPPPPPRDSQDAERDVFAKSDKWLPSLPVIDFTSWKDRISEALGFLTWMEKLTSWVGLGSEVFPNELMHAVRTKDEAVLGQDRLTVEQQKRSIRLLHILRQTFAGHDKSSLILQNYVEGAASYQQSGFVALRLLSKEFCLKSRSECLYFRSQLANQTVKAPTIPEIVRKIESEQHKYSKLLSSLDPDVQSQGLELQEADLVMVLLRSLPERCRSYCLLHGDSDSFEDLKRVALKYEVQQRVWSEGPGTKLNPFKPDGKGKDGDEKGASKGKGKKGKRGRSQSASKSDAKGSKDVECFNCGKKGHFARDCWAPAKKNDGKDAPNPKSGGKPSPKGKAKAKGGKEKGKGKGKTVAEVANGEGDSVDLTGNQEWTEPEAEAHVSSVLQQLNEIVEVARRDWIPPAQDEFVVTREAGFQVRMTELEHRIASDLNEMLGKEVPGSVNLLRGSQVNGVSSLNNDQMSNWWLIDSGASVTVIAKKFLDSFTVVSRMPLCPSERYSAANDTPVTVFERVRVRVKMPLYEGDSYIGMVPVMVTGVVADVGHNILSTEHMVAAGWEVKFSKAEISLRRVKGGLVGYGQSWAGCPWIYLQGAETTKKVTFGRTHVKMDVDQEGSSSPMEVGNVSAMTVKMKEELEVHRMRGHIPFMSGCPHCQKTRGVTQHRRGKDVGNRPVELQADFCFINLVTGTFVKDQPNAPNMKILVLTEMSTRMVGCALVGTSADHTSTWIRYWMNAFGLTTAGSAVLLRTDSETAVSALIRRANLGIRIVTQRAPPQGHESVGGVERAVRTLKELFSTIRLDLRAQGYDLKRSPRAFELGLIYCAAMHNHHSAAFDGKKSPQELVLQRPLPECASTLIGMTVLAELPDSMKKTSLSRFVEAAYLYPEAGGLTHVVSSMVNGTPHHYRAKSIKHITPLKVGFEHCEHLLKVYDPSDTLAPPILKELDDGIPSEVQGEVDKAFEGKVSQGPTTDMSQVGPPAAWVREHGGTPGCPACGEKRGKANHNAACKRRYDKWLKDQRERLVGDGEQESVGDEPGSGSTTAQKVSSEARSSEDAGVPVVSAPSLKRPKTSHGSTDLEGEEPSAASKPDVIDVEMFEDPSIPYENIPDEEMPPGYFEGEQPMEVEKEVVDGTEPMSVESQEVPSEPSRVPKRLEALHPRLDAPEGFTSAVGELEAPKMAKVVNAVLIEKNTVFPEQVQMCGSKVWLAKMKSALSELDGCPLDVSSAMDGRRTELKSMDSHKAGRIVSADEAHAFAKKHGIRIIPTRWVLGPKVVNGKEAVRARCVVQDVAKGSTASSLGLSATTPSLEALRTLLAIAAKDSMDIATLDVSTAFLHSPLPKGEKAVIMLPRDVSSSSDHYAPVYMILDQAMNGLRVAAKAWNLKLANVVKKVGLNQCPTEPSVFEGTVKGKRFLMLCYVDDLILCGSSEAIKLVTDTLNSELKIKETGRITPTGGRIVFLGREIERHGEHLRMRVPPKYMESLFETDFCKELKVLSSPPDIVKTSEKGHADPEKDSLLTEAAAMRYRAVLGRIAWWAQSRPDLARWMSILSQGQSKPTACFEHALRQVIRFLKGQYLCWHYFGPGSEVPDAGPARLDVYADASWAPQASLGRKLVSGIAIYYRGSLIKGISRIQGCVSLSSCEAELRAILTAVQESEGLATLIGQLAGSKVEIRLHTDSSSARAVLLNRGLSRRVRHLDIAVCYLQERIQEAQTLKVLWCPTSAMVADIMTKCLSCELFMRHQQALRIFEDENVQQVWRICGIRHFEDSGFYQNHYPCEVDGCDVTCESWSVRSDSGSSTTEASPFAEVVPVLTDDKMGSHPDAQKGSMEAPYWCKKCKWLFKNDQSHGLGWTADKPMCEKCKGEITVWGSNASHAFRLREGEKEKRKGNKGEGKSSPWVPGDGGKGDGANQGVSPMAKGMPKPETMFPDLNASEMPDWYTELWARMGVRGAPLNQVDLQPMVESLRDEDLQRYKESFEKLSHPNLEVYEQVPMPGKVMAVLDMRAQIGGKSVIWETAVTGGCVYVDMSPGLSGLAVLAFVQYLKRKGLLVLILVSGHQDLGVLRMMDLLYALPILGVERCVKDELETTSHPSWVCRWKEHAQKGNVVFGTLVYKVWWMSELTCRTIKIHDPKMKDLGKPLPLWAYFAYTNNDVVKESLIGDDGMMVGVLESIREPVNWQCDCSWHVASDYTSRFNTNLPCILWEHIWKFLGENTQKLMDAERSIEQAVLAAVAARDLEENKRKRREELDAAEEEAAKKARRSLEQPSPSSPPASPVFDGAMIAQIAEMVKASLSVGDLEKLLDEKKKAAEPCSAQQASEPRGAQQGQMDQRVTELEEMKDAARERRSKMVERAAEAKDADDPE